MRVEDLNTFASRVWTRLVAEYPEWTQYADTLDHGDLEVAVPAPAGSNAGHLVISTNRGEELWVRFSPPQMFYPLDDEDEMLSIIRMLIDDEALFSVTRRGNEWTGTTLIRPEDEPTVEKGVLAHIVSWSGKLDRTIGNRSSD